METIVRKPVNYIPAMGYDWLLPLYDPMQRWVLREERYRQQLIQQADLTGVERVLDLGCGTGTLTTQLKQQYPRLQLVGLDGDERALRLARRKAWSQHVHVKWKHALCQDLPFEEDSFDHVFASLIFHHLDRQQTMITLQEVKRVLKAGGTLHVLDFGRPTNNYAHLAACVTRFQEHVRDHTSGWFAAQLTKVFEQTRVVTRVQTLAGSFWILNSSSQDVSCEIKVSTG